MSSRAQRVVRPGPPLSLARTRRTFDILALALCALVVATCTTTKFDLEATILDRLGEARDDAQVDLRELAPFEWDRAVVLRPYLDEETVDAIVGFDVELRTAMNDGVLTVAFLDQTSVRRKSQIPAHLVRFDGPALVINAGDADLIVVVDAGESYLVPPGTGPRGTLCGPNGDDGCGP